MGAGHAARAEHPLQVQLAGEEQIDDRFADLRGKPGKKRDVQNIVARCV